MRARSCSNERCLSTAPRSKGSVIRFSHKPVKDALEPLRLLLGWLTPNRPSRHIVDELALVLSQPAVVLLAEQRDLVPGWGAVDVVEFAGALALDCAHTGLKAGIVELAHFGVGELAAVRVLDPLGKAVNVGAGGFEGAHDGACRPKSLAILIACE